MSITVLLDKTKHSVRLLEWFGDKSLDVLYPQHLGSEASWESFRDSGAHFVRSHFDRLRSTRISQKESPTLFEDRVGKLFLSRQIPIDIGCGAKVGEIVVTPMYFRRLSLAGLKSACANGRIRLIANWTDEMFWCALDQAINVAKDV